MPLSISDDKSLIPNNWFCLTSNILFLYYNLGFVLCVVAGVLGTTSLGFVGPIRWSYPSPFFHVRFNVSYGVIAIAHATKVHDYSSCYDYIMGYFLSLTSSLWVGTSLIQFSCPRRSLSKLFYCCLSFISFIFLSLIISSYWSAIYCFSWARLYRLIATSSRYSCFFRL